MILRGIKMKTILFEGKISKVAIIKVLSAFSKKGYHSRLSPVVYKKFPDPKLPAENWVRVKNIQTGICGSDMTFYRCAQGPSTAFLPMPCSEATYLGHETVGEVVEIGSAVKNFKVGDKVCMRKYMASCELKGFKPDEFCDMCKMGNYSDCENYGEPSKFNSPVGAGMGDSYIAPEGQLLEVNDLTNDEAVLVEPFAVSLHAVLKHVPKPNDKVLVIGAGMIGLNVIQFAKLLMPECKIYVMENNPNKHSFAKKLGADEILSGDPYQAVAKATNGKLYEKGNNRMILGGFDVIYDCVGKGTLFNDTLRWLKAQGTLVKVGYQMTKTKFDETPIWWQGLNIIGADSHGLEMINGKQKQTFEIVKEMMLKKQLITEGFITHRFAIDDYKKAFKLLIENPRDTIKVVLKCD